MVIDQILHNITVNLKVTFQENSFLRKNIRIIPPNKIVFNRSSIFNYVQLPTYYLVITFYQIVESAIIKTDLH